MNKNELLTKAFGYQILFAIIVFISLSIFFPVYLEDAVTLRDEFNEYQQNIPQIDPNVNEEVEILAQEVGRIDAVVEARNSILINSSLLFIFLLAVSSVLFTLQRRIFPKKQSFKKVFLTLLLVQLGLFVFSLVYLFVASYLAANFGLIENTTTITVSFFSLAIIYSYVFVLFYVQDKSKVKQTVKIHSMFVIIGLLYSYILYYTLNASMNVMTTSMSQMFLYTILVLILSVIGVGIAAYEKYLLFKK